MHRLFVALQPPPDVRASLTACMGGIEGARWQSDAQLHATLLFVGEVDRHTAEDIAARLQPLTASPLDVRLTGFGTFDTGRSGRIGTLWVGLDPLDGLTALSRKVGRALLPAGIPPETRRFTPHITLARFPARGVAPRALERFLLDTPAPRGGWRADALLLYESSLGRGGAHYTPVLRVPLAFRESSADPHRPSA